MSSTICSTNWAARSKYHAKCKLRIWCLSLRAPSQHLNDRSHPHRRLSTSFGQNLPSGGSDQRAMQGPPRNLKDDNKLTDATERGLISWTKDGAELPKDVKMSFSGTKQWLISRISILQANRVHNGVYNCTVAGKQSTSAQVQVLNGETPALMQHNSGHRCEEAIILVHVVAKDATLSLCALRNLGWFQLNNLLHC